MFGIENLAETIPTKFYFEHISIVRYIMFSDFVNNNKVFIIHYKRFTLRLLRGKSYTCTLISVYICLINIYPMDLPGITMQ